MNIRVNRTMNASDRAELRCASWISSRAVTGASPIEPVMMRRIRCQTRVARAPPTNGMTNQVLSKNAGTAPSNITRTLVIWAITTRR
nr:hypothetical protein ISGA_11685 [Gordonia sp. NB41Y]